MTEAIPAATLAAHSDEFEAVLEARLAARLDALARLVEREPARARPIALRVARALHEFTGLEPKQEAKNVMAAMDLAVRGGCGWDTVERLHRMNSTFFLNAAMFSFKGFARAMICHLVSHLSARKPDFRYVADNFCRLLERRIKLHHEDIAVEFTHGAAIHAFLACTIEPAREPETE